jgi:nucleotide-binding universal stress UspA family protein
MSIFPTKILVATDGSEEAELAAGTAADLARSTGSELHFVIIFQEAAYIHPYYEARLPKVADQLRQQAREEIQKVLDEQMRGVQESGVEVTEAHLRAGQPDGEIVTLAEELGAGLIVMGSRGLGGVRRALMGSVADCVVRHAHCPVMVVRQVEERAT